MIKITHDLNIYCFNTIIDTRIIIDAANGQNMTIFWNTVDSLFIAVV